MVSQKITVKNMTGFHLRPAGILCKIAMNYKSKVQFQFNSVTANAKSVLSVLGAGVKNGDEIEVVCDGVDEEEALKTHHSCCHKKYTACCHKKIIFF